MSAMGQKRTLRRGFVMSVRFTPESGHSDALAACALRGIAHERRFRVVLGESVLPLSLDVLRHRSDTTLSAHEV
jgi:hypothetical protein